MKFSFIFAAVAAMRIELHESCADTLTTGETVGCPEGKVCVHGDCMTEDEARAARTRAAPSNTVPVVEQP